MKVLTPASSLVVENRGDTVVSVTITSADGSSEETVTVDPGGTEQTTVMYDSIGSISTGLADDRVVVYPHKFQVEPVYTGDWYDGS